MQMETLLIDSKFTKQYHDKTLTKSHSPIPSDPLTHLPTYSLMICSKTPPSRNLCNME